MHREVSSNASARGTCDETHEAVYSRTWGSYEGTYITRIFAVGFLLRGIELEVLFPRAILVDSARVSLARFLVLPVVSSICSLFIPDAFAVGSVRILQVRYNVCSMYVPAVSSLASAINNCFSLPKGYFSNINTTERSSSHNLQSWPTFVVTLKPPLSYFPRSRVPYGNKSSEHQFQQIPTNFISEKSLTNVLYDKNEISVRFPLGIVRSLWGVKRQRVILLNL